MKEDFQIQRRQMIRKLVVDMAIPESTIERVISFQFNSMEEALRTYKTVEMSGFGKFVLSDKRITKAVDHYNRLIEKYTKMQQEEISELKKRNIDVWIEVTKGKIKSITSIKNRE